MFGATRTTKSIPPTPPEKGSFPLDHEGRCKPEAQSYIRCLKMTKNDAKECLIFQQSYLKCRMENSLMTQQDFESLGFEKDLFNTKNSQANNSTTASTPTQTQTPKK